MTGVGTERPNFEIFYTGHSQGHGSLQKNIRQPRNRDHIAVVSSVVGTFGTPLRSSYAASKHALHGWFDSLRAELHDGGIRGTLVCPGFKRLVFSVSSFLGASPISRLSAGNQ